MKAPFRDQRGVAKYRHEVLVVALRVGGDRSAPDRRAPRLQVLALRRDHEPYAGRWALPGSPVEVDESMEDAVARRLNSELGLTRLRHREQLATFSDPARDPFERTIATAYLGLMPAVPAPEIPGSTWLDLTEPDELPEMAFDHRGIVEQGADRLRGKISYTNIAFALAPAEFTMAELRGIYEAVLGHEVDVTNLSRVLRRRGQIERVGTHAESGARGGRPPSTWRFTEDDYRVTDPFAVLGPGRA